MLGWGKYEIKLDIVPDIVLFQLWEAQTQLQYHHYVTLIWWTES